MSFLKHPPAESKFLAALAATWQTLDKASVGLSEVENTSDADKPISDATAIALVEKAPLASPIFTGTVTLPGDPIEALEAATKQYVDNVAQGITAKASVVAATSANVILSGEQSIDGILTSQSRVLVKNQTDPSENGIYVTASGFWTRAADMSSWSEVPSAYVFIEAGNTLSNTGWVCNSQSGGTLGTTAVTWTQFSGAGEYTASGGITKTGNEFVLSAMAAYTLKGNANASAGAPSDLTFSTVTDLLNLFTSGARGLVPASGGGTTKFLRADGNWATTTSAWGSITGSLIDQADLWSALNAREPSIATGTVGQFWRGDKTWQSLSKDDVGLEAVDNTSDLDKPVSTATQASLNSKLDLSHAGTGGFAHADATTTSGGFMSAADKTKIDGIATGATVNSPDSILRNRSNHTGTQDANTVEIDGIGLAGRLVGGRGGMTLVTLGQGLTLSGGVLTATGGMAHNHPISDVTGLQAALDSKIAISLSGTTGLALLGAANSTAARTTLGLGTAALSNTTAFAAANHSHTIASIPGLSSALDAKQPLDSTLTGLASLGTTLGLIEQINENAFVKRSIGVANETDILSRAHGDARFAAIAHAHSLSSITGLDAALDAKLDSSAVGTAGLSVIAGETIAAIRTTLGLGSAALVNTTAFAAAVHTHAISDIVGLPSALSVVDDHDVALDTLLVSLSTIEGEIAGLQNTVDGKQAIDPTLTALAALDSSAGVLVQTGADAFSKRGIGTNPTDLLTRGDADTLYLGGNSHTHEISDVEGLTAALAAKEATISAGSTSQYWRGDKSWQTLDKAAVGLPNVDNTTDLNKPISTATATALASKIDASEKAQANGVATLDGTGKILSSQIPPIAISTPHVVTSDAEMLALSAQVGDIAIRTDVARNYIHNGGSSGTISDWNELQGGAGGVSSVNTQTGVVTLGKADIGLANVDNTSDANKPVSTAQQTALNAKANTIHGHAISDVTGLQSALDGKADDADLAGKANTIHGHAISDVTGLQSALDGKADDADLAGKANTTHAHAISDVTGLQGALDGKASSSHNHDGVYAPASHNHSSLYQPLDGDLTSIAGLTGTTGFAKKTAANTWTLDTASYALTSHNHDATYAPIGHNHDSTYAPIGHNHDATYAALSHAHAIGDVTGLSAALSGKEATIAAGTTAQYWRGDKSWQTLNKAAVGLANVDNTSDANKPVSTAQQSALDAKINSSAATAFGLSLLGAANSASGTALLDHFSATLKGLVPPPTAASGRFLKDDGTWAIPPSADGGATTFFELSDAADYSAGDANKVVKVNSTGTGLDYGVILGTAASQNTTAFAPATHTHAISDVTGLQTALNTKLNTSAVSSFALTYLDETSAEGVRTALQLGSAATADAAAFAEVSHTHLIANITGLQTALNNKEPSITSGTTAQYLRGDKSWQTLNKAAVGLANVDNTSDANKPISSATQSALDAKAPLASPTFTGTVTLSANPTANLHAATKQYVDNVAQGLDAKGSVKCTANAQITLTGEKTIDGVTTSASRVLVRGNPLFPALRSSNELPQTPSRRKQIPSS